MTATLNRRSNRTDDLKPTWVRLPDPWLHPPSTAPTDQAAQPALLVERVTKRFKIDRRKPPVVAIDDVKLDVQAFIEEMRDIHETTIVLTTHDLDEAGRLCDRIDILDRGRVVAEDTPQGLMDMVARDHGLPATLESVFMTYTGRSLDDDVEDEPDDSNERR